LSKRFSVGLVRGEAEGAGQLGGDVRFFRARIPGIDERVLEFDDDRLPGREADRVRNPHLAGTAPQATGVAGEEIAVFFIVVVSLYFALPHRFR
jgi:hypothetical protein